MLSETHTVQCADRSHLKLSSDSEHPLDILLPCQTFKTLIRTQSRPALVTQ